MARSTEGSYRLNVLSPAAAARLAVSRGTRLLPARTSRVATLVVVGVLWVFAAYGLMLGWGRVAPADQGADHRFYVAVADRWLETGQL